MVYSHKANHCFQVVLFNAGVWGGYQKLGTVVTSWLVSHLAPGTWLGDYVPARATRESHTLSTSMCEKCMRIQWSKSVLSSLTYAVQHQFTTLPLPTCKSQYPHSQMIFVQSFMNGLDDQSMPIEQEYRIPRQDRASIGDRRLPARIINIPHT